MKQKTVVITCAPTLSELQSAGLMQLILDFEKRQYRVFYYGNLANKDFERYLLNELSFNKAFYKIPFYKVLLLIKRIKWITRIAHHYPPGDHPVADDKLLRAIVRSSVKYFCSTKPDLFICWNPHSPTFGPMADTARLMGISTGAIEWGLLPGTYILDKNGTLATSRIFNQAINYSDPKKFRSIGQNIFDELTQKSVSLYQQASQPLPKAALNTQAHHTRILLIGIDMVDSGSLPETDADHLGLLPFHNSCEDQALDIAASDADFRVIYKPHPSHNYNQQSGQLSANCWIVNSNPDELIKWADVVICSGSKMEFSALLAGKPLVNIGAGILYKKGCSYEVDAPSALRQQIAQAQLRGVTLQQLNAFKTFLGFLHNDYLYIYDRPHDNSVVIDRMLQRTSFIKRIAERLFKSV